jgi:hypothetical protein
MIFQKISMAHAVTNTIVFINMNTTAASASATVVVVVVVVVVAVVVVVVVAAVTAIIITTTAVTSLITQVQYYNSEVLQQQIPARVTLYQKQKPIRRTNYFPPQLTPDSIYIPRHSDILHHYSEQARNNLITFALS